MADLGPAERALVRMLGVAPGDYRDLAEVQRWAASIAQELAVEAPIAEPGATSPVSVAGGSAERPRDAVASR